MILRRLLRFLDRPEPRLHAPAPGQATPRQIAALRRHDFSQYLDYMEATEALFWKDAQRASRNPVDVAIEDYRADVRAFTADNLDLFVPLAHAMHHDGQIMNVTRQTYGLDVRMPWGRAPWLTRLAPMLDALLSHGLHLGIAVEGREQYDQHRGRIESAVSEEILCEVLAVVLEGRTGPDMQYHAYRIYSEAFMTTCFARNGTPLPGTVRGWPSDLARDRIAVEPQASAALALARRHALRIRRRHGLHPFGQRTRP